MMIAILLSENDKKMIGAAKGESNSNHNPKFDSSTYAVNIHALTFHFDLAASIEIMRSFTSFKYF